MKRKQKRAVVAPTAAEMENIVLKTENEIYKVLLKANAIEIHRLNSIINEAIAYCETKKRQRKQNRDWLKELANDE